TALRVIRRGADVVGFATVRRRAPRVPFGAGVGAAGAGPPPLAAPRACYGGGAGFPGGPRGQPPPPGRAPDPARPRGGAPPRGAPPAAHEPRPPRRRPQGPPLGLLRPGEGLSGAFAGAPLGVGTASRAGRHRPDPARLAGPTLLCYNPRTHPTSPSAPFFVSI